MFYKWYKFKEGWITWKTQKISENLFSGCKSLESIEIPSSVTEIEDQAFEDTAIKELKIPESVTSVGETVFRYTKIEKLYLPESLTTISSSFLGDLDDTDTSYKLTVYVKKAHMQMSILKNINGQV